MAYFQLKYVLYLFDFKNLFICIELSKHMKPEYPFRKFDLSRILKINKIRSIQFNKSIKIDLNQFYFGLPVDPNFKNVINNKNVPYV